MPIFVKASRRGNSIVRAYTRTSQGTRNSRKFVRKGGLVERVHRLEAKMRGVGRHVIKRSKAVDFMYRHMGDPSY